MTKDYHAVTVKHKKLLIGSPNEPLKWTLSDLERSNSMYSILKGYIS